MGLLKLQFHPGTNMAQAVAENGCSYCLIRAPRLHADGKTVPPFRVALSRRRQRSGSAISSSRARPKPLPELQDAALFKVRPLFATLPGVFGTSAFSVRVSARIVIPRRFPPKLRAYNMSPRRGGAGR